MSAWLVGCLVGCLSVGEWEGRGPCRPSPTAHGRSPLITRHSNTLRSFLCFCLFEVVLWMVYTIKFLVLSILMKDVN